MPNLFRHLKLKLEILKQVQDDALVGGRYKIRDACTMQQHLDKNHYLRKFISLQCNLPSKRHAVAPMADRHLKINIEILKQVQDDALVGGSC